MKRRAAGIGDPGCVKRIVTVERYPAAIELWKTSRIRLPPMGMRSWTACDSARMHDSEGVAQTVPLFFASQMFEEEEEDLAELLSIDGRRFS